jgi:hypothetical protein
MLARNMPIIRCAWVITRGPEPKVEHVDIILADGILKAWWEGRFLGRTP